MYAAVSKVESYIHLNNVYRVDVGFLQMYLVGYQGATAEYNPLWLDEGKPLCELLLFGWCLKKR